VKNKSKLHIRRCHLCTGVTENEGAPVDKCLHCGKPMAPFYFFDELDVTPLSDAEVRVEAQLKAGQRTPVRGFTAYW
jgi:hypothetical protein